MNHYERLKVSRDAPPEVIRAAYRALANKLHPDRAAATPTGPDDAQHAQMAALNAAYETLMNPAARAAYDEALQMARATAPGAGTARSARPEAARPEARATRAARSAAGPASVLVDDDESRNGPNTRIDMDWLTPRSTASTPLWPPSRRTAWLGGTLGALLVALGLVWAWQMWGQHQMEQALSRQYASQPDAPAAGLRPADVAPRALAANAAAPAVPPARRPTVEELSRLSDEELLQVLPTLDNEVAVSERHELIKGPSLITGRPHPLDGGVPLNLRSDIDLVDPLAP